MTQPNHSVLFEELATGNDKKIGVVTLNAERSLNALSADMVALLTPQLTKWKSDSQIALVILQGTGEKAFCAGGDIVDLYTSMKANHGEYSPEIEQFFTSEYELDHLIHTFEKPFLVWGTRIVMGGGLGLLAGGSHRVVTEASRIAMPEISIGLYPDVGGSYFLNRMPKGCGLFLGLTGASINGTDAKYVHLADYFVGSSYREELVSVLVSKSWSHDTEENHKRLSEQLDMLEDYSSPQRVEAKVEPHQSLISDVTSGDNLADIIDAILDVKTDEKWFSKAQQSLKKGSCISALICYRQLREGKGLSLADCFRLELTLSVKCGKFGEFQEGVRALLIDKDGEPNWMYSKVDQVSDKVIDWFFEPKWEVQQHPLNSL